MVQPSGRGRDQQHNRDIRVPMQELKDNERVDSDTGSEPEDTGLSRPLQFRKSRKKLTDTLEQWKKANPVKKIKGTRSMRRKTKVGLRGQRGVME